MGNMVTGGMESLALFALSLLFFILIGIRRSTLKASAAQFWHAGRNISAEQLSATWSAGSLSLGLVILYYMTMTSVFGWKIFIISILTYMIGQFVFRHVAVKWRLNNPDTEVSVEELVTSGTGQKVLITFAQLSGLFSLMAMLYAELFFSSLFINSLLGSSSSWASTCLFLVSIIIVSLYVLFGGMLALIEADKWLLYLIYGAVSTLVLLAIILLANGTPVKYESTLPWFVGSLETPDTLSYFLFGLAANILPLLCQNSLWQMASSTKTDDVSTGTLWGIMKTFFVITIIIFVAFVINGDGKRVTTDILVQSMTALGNFGSYFLLPIMFVGLMAAMLSTADNLLLSSALSIKHLTYNYKILNLNRFGEVKERIILVVGVSLLQISVYIFVTHIMRREFFDYFINLVFYLFSQAAPFGVVVFLSALYPYKIRRSGLLVFGILLAWLIDFAAFIYTVSTGVMKLQFFATPIAIIVAFIFAIDFKSNKS